VVQVFDPVASQVSQLPAVVLVEDMFAFFTISLPIGPRSGWMCRPW
jgi:hypothetical protein